MIPLNNCKVIITDEREGEVMGWFYLPSPRLDLKLLLFRTKLISWNGDTFLSASSLFFWSSSGVYCIFVKPISKSYLFVLTFISVSLPSRSSRYISSSSRKWLLFKTGATECQPNSGDLERPLFVAADWRYLPTNSGPAEELWKKIFLSIAKEMWYMFSFSCSVFYWQWRWRSISFLPKDVLHLI